MSLKCVKTYPNTDGLFEQVAQTVRPDTVNPVPASPFLDCCLVVIDDNRPVARIAIYINPNIRYNGKKTALIGSFECANDKAIANYLFDEVTDHCKTQNVEYLIGPMEGSTWENYRFFDTFDAPSFITESRHPKYYPELFKENGFDPIANYVSRFEEGTVVDWDKLHEHQRRFEESGIRIRYMDTGKIEEELIHIAKFCNRAFSRNFLFSPIEPSYFRNKYLQLNELIHPEFSIIAESGENIVGLAFGIADNRNDLFIVKTLAKLNMEDTRGLGYHLVDLLIANAYDAGYKRIIHAFMINDNRSINISNKRKSEIYRTYSLYGREI